MKKNIINTPPTFRTVMPDETLSQEEWMKYANVGIQYDHKNPWWKLMINKIYQSCKKQAEII